MRITIVLACIAVVGFIYCSSFVKKDMKPLLKELQKEEYVLQQDVSIGGLTLAKNQRIKIVIASGKEWVKVYGFPVGEDELKSRRVLILYLFENDFPAKVFDLSVFKNKLKEVAVRGDEIKPVVKKTIIKKGKK